MTMTMIVAASAAEHTHGLNDHQPVACSTDGVWVGAEFRNRVSIYLVTARNNPCDIAAISGPLGAATSGSKALARV